METITIFGQAMTVRSHVEPFIRDERVWIQTWTDSERATCSILVTQFRRAQSVELRIDAPTFADAECLWLETASVETPRLCALVVDLMAMTKTEAA